jgi:hypothetical protein
VFPDLEYTFHAVGSFSALRHLLYLIKEYIETISQPFGKKKDNLKTV